MKNEHVFPNHCFHETKKIILQSIESNLILKTRPKLVLTEKNIQEGLDGGELQSNNVSIINKVIEMQHIALLGN